MADLKRRLDRLESRNADTERPRFIVSDLPEGEEDGGRQVAPFVTAGKPMSADEWETTYCSA
jgi:hypothetical protein